MSFERKSNMLFYDNQNECELTQRHTSQPFTESRNNLLPIIQQNLTGNIRTSDFPNTVDGKTGKEGNYSEEYTGNTDNNNKMTRDLNMDDVKRLVLRLHRQDASITDPSMMTDIEKKIYVFLKRNLPTSDDVTSDSKPIKDKWVPRGRPKDRVWTEDAYRKLNIVFGKKT